MILNMIFKIMKRPFFLYFLFLIYGSLAAAAQAEVLMGREQALVQAYGQGREFVPRPLTLTASQVGALEKRLGARLLSPYCDLVEVRHSGRLEGLALVDEELGKHQPITFLISMDAKAHIRKIDLLVYRERYGGGVRSERFTNQFKGKSSADPLKITRDLDAVTGATISSKALSLGARKAVILADHTLLGKPL
jgi:electron transport complex protein RnfG